jgi:hypothetical protein
MSVEWERWHPTIEKKRSIMRAQIENWARLEVWATEVPGEWAWKVGTGGPHGMSWICTAPSEQAAKKAAEAFLRDLLIRAAKQIPDPEER